MCCGKVHNRVINHIIVYSILLRYFLLFYFLLQIARCDACQWYEKAKTVAPKLTPIKIVEPKHMVGMDLIGRSCYVMPKL